MKNIPNLIKKHPYYTASIVVVILLLIVFTLSSKEEPENATEASIRTVTTINVADYSKGALGVVVPTAGGNSFVVRAEASGRVDSVRASGTEVSQGDIIAELDNDTQRAALVQAQGTYEAALASAAQSDVSVNDAKAALTAAKQTAVSSNRSAYSDWSNVLYNTVDQLFSNPRSDVPGVRINAQSYANTLNDERVAFTEVLNTWQREMNSVKEIDDSNTLINTLDQAIAHTERLIKIVNIFITILPKENADGAYNANELATLQTEFAAARTTLNSSLSSLSSAKTSLQRAEEALNKAEIGGTTSDVSAANAAVKQALGAYQSAQAAYQRTLVKAPFNGTLSAVNITKGDIINLGTDVAIIIPEEGVDTSKSFDLPLAAIKYTPDNSYVFTLKPDNTIEAISVETGLVTANNINVTGLNGDEVIINDVRGLKAGQHVNTQ